MSVVCARSIIRIGVEALWVRQRAFCFNIKRAVEGRVSASGAAPSNARTKDEP